MKGKEGINDFSNAAAKRDPSSANRISGRAQPSKDFRDDDGARRDRAGAINAISPQRFSRNPLLHYLPHSFAFISGAAVSGVFAVEQIRVFNTCSFCKKKKKSSS